MLCLRTFLFGGEGGQDAQADRAFLFSFNKFLESCDFVCKR